MNFFSKRNKKNKIFITEDKSLEDFYLPPSESKKKSSILDVLEPKKKSSDELTDALLKGIIDFKERTPELNHYRKEILEILNSDDGESLFFEHLGNNINKK